MSLIGTRIKKHNVVTSESGQAALEYILVLLIAVILITTFVYQFSSAFKKYANNYFGDYIACLLETGELPGQTNGQCSPPTYNLADGKTATGGSVSSGGIGSGSGSGSDSGKSGSSATNAKKSDKSASNSNNSSSSSSTANSGGEVVAPSGSGGSGFGFDAKAGRKRSTPVASQSAGGTGSESGREGLKAIGHTSGNGSSGGSDGRGRRTPLTRGFRYEGENEDDKRALERPTSKVVGRDDSESLRPVKAVQAPLRGPAANADASDSGFTVGDFVRVLLIAAILILIFVLFGGQLLAISKGGEK